MLIQLRNKSFQQTIPKNLVHKWSIHEVFLTSYEICSPLEMILYAELPRSHSFYCETPLQIKAPDLTLLVEVCRQACFVIAHVQFDVPLEGNCFQFLFQELNAHLLTQQTLSSDKPLDIAITSKIKQQWLRGSITSSLEYDFSIYVNDIHLAQICIRMTWIERKKWKEMRMYMRRGRNLDSESNIFCPLTTFLKASDVGRINRENILLEKVIQDGNSWVATPIINIKHPVLFDHPIDHIYAMVQIEACRQLAFFIISHQIGYQTSNLEMIRCSIRFESVAEFDLATNLKGCICLMEDEVLSNLPEKISINIEIIQGCRLVSRCSLLIRHIENHSEIKK